MLLESHVLIAATGLLRKFGRLHTARAETPDSFSIRTSVGRRLSGTVSYQRMISYSRSVSGIRWRTDLHCMNQPFGADRLHLRQTERPGILDHNLFDCGTHVAHQG
jgi:hypothetical protein